MPTPTPSAPNAIPKLRGYKLTTFRIGRMKMRSGWFTEWVQTGRLPLCSSMHGSDLDTDSQQRAGEGLLGWMHQGRAILIGIKPLSPQRERLKSTMRRGQVYNHCLRSSDSEPYAHGNSIHCDPDFNDTLPHHHQKKLPGVLVNTLVNQGLAGLRLLCICQQSSEGCSLPSPTSPKFKDCTLIADLMAASIEL